MKYIEDLDLWVNSDSLKSAYGGQLAVFCNRHKAVACMHFMKDSIGIRNFYCQAEVYINGSLANGEIEMYDDAGNRLRVKPKGFHNYNSFFNANDLVSAGVFVQEINYLRRENK